MMGSNITGNTPTRTLSGPCYSCEDRHMLCHSECSKYIEYKDKLKLINDKRKDEVQLSLVLSKFARR